MSGDDQWFLDHLVTIRNELGRNFEDFAEAIDRTVNSLAGQISPWIPENVRAPAPGDASAIFRSFSAQPPPKSSIERVLDFVYEHQALVAAICAFLSTTGVLVVSRKAIFQKRRRARKAANGCRKEIIVIAGSPHEPMTRSVANDLERKGFIVYVTVMSGEEERLVRAEGRKDILPLWIDITSVTPSNTDIHPSLHALHNLITRPQTPSPGMYPHTCHLTGLILLPPQRYPTGSLSTLAPSTLIDTVNSRLISPILLTQQFLPLLSANRHGNPGAIILLNPSIPTSLSLPYSIPEITSASALSGFAASLRHELQQKKTKAYDIPVTEIKLGNIDQGQQYARSSKAMTADSSSINNPSSTEILSWDLATRARFATSGSAASAASSSSSPELSARSRSSSPRSNKASALVSPAWSLSPFAPTSSRDLHAAIYDALRRSNGRSGSNLVYVGRGAWSYNVIGRWAPGGLVGWMLRSKFKEYDVETGLAGVPSWGSGSETWERV